MSRAGWPAGPPRGSVRKSGRISSRGETGDQPSMVAAGSTLVAEEEESSAALASLAAAAMRAVFAIRERREMGIGPPKWGRKIVPISGGIVLADSFLRVEVAEKPSRWT